MEEPAFYNKGNKVEKIQKEDLQLLYKATGMAHERLAYFNGLCISLLANKGEPFDEKIDDVVGDLWRLRIELEREISQREYLSNID